MLPNSGEFGYRTGKLPNSGEFGYRTGKLPILANSATRDVEASLDSPSLTLRVRIGQVENLSYATLTLRQLIGA